MAYDFNSLMKQAPEATNRDGFYTDFEDVDTSKLHQITELTEWMRTKAKGSDVREVIAQLFERTWLEESKEGNANMEVAKARGQFPVLNDRLNNADRERAENARKLAQKANKDEVTNVMTPKGNIAYASLPMTGNSVGWYYYCPDGDGTHGAGNYVWNGTSWYFGGTGDEGYNLLKKDLINYSSIKEKPYVNLYNLYDETKTKQNVYINNIDGTEQPYTGWSSSNYIEIEENKAYNYKFYHDTGYTYRQVYYAFYNSAGVFTHGGVVNGTTATETKIQASKNDKYIRFSALTNRMIDVYGMLMEHSICSSTSVYYPYVKIPNTSQILKNVEDISVNNLMPVEPVHFNKYISDTDGTLVDYENWVTTDYIDISKLDILIAYSNAGTKFCAFYDNAKKFISNFNINEKRWKPIKIPTDAKYIRISNIYREFNSIKIVPFVYFKHTGSPFTKYADDIIKEQKRLFTFCVQTDTHFSKTNEDESIFSNGIENLVDLTNTVSFDYICNLGDIVQGYQNDSIATTRNDLTYVVSKYKDSKCPALLTIGNHDCNSQSIVSSEIITNDELYARVIKATATTTDIVQNNESIYYYKDFENFRVVMLNSQDGANSSFYNFSDSQIEWFENVALKTNKDIIVMCHAGLNSQISDDVPTNSDRIINALKEYQTSGGKVVGIFSGHQHARNQFKIDGINHISFINKCDRADVVYVDYVNKTIKTKMIGNFISDLPERNLTY